MSQITQKSLNKNEERISFEFCTYVKVKILKQKEWISIERAFKRRYLCEEHNTVPFINDMKLLRQHFEKNFVDLVRYFDSGSQVVVYSAKTKPCHYVVASTL